MKQRAEKFLDEWIEKYDLIEVCSSRDQTKVERLARRLIADAEAEGISETDLTEAFNHDTRFSALADLLVPKA
ncbi:hypothetical protein NKJ88_30670 [Mesorhizobium sp. M0016]|uniref:hypothetical protein n=1 Tax=Mesorhizobium sp. M0016 TaxID=2956843 RepID=UPI003339DB49